MSVLSRLWDLREDRPRLFLVSLGAIAFFALYPLVDLHLRWLKSIGAPGFDRVTPFTYNDLSAFTYAVERWYDGKSIYWQQNGGYHGSYLYPPAYLLVFVPVHAAQDLDFLTALPFVVDGFDAAAVLWGSFSIALLWVGLQLVVSELGGRLRWFERVGLLWLLIGFQPLLYSFKWAQTAGFQGGLLCFAYVGYSRGRTASEGGGRLANVASGALTTLASGMKPFYATSGAHLLRNGYRLAGAIGAGVVLLVVSLGVFGLDTSLKYLEVLTWGKGWGTEPIGPWLWGPTYYRPFYAVATWSTELALALRVVGILAVIGLVLAARNGDAGRETFALGLAAIPLFAPTAYTYDFVSLLPAAAILLAVEFERDGRPWLVVAAVWLLGVQAYGLKLLVHHLPPWLPARDFLATQASPLLQPGLVGNLLLFGLAAYGVARCAPGLHAGPLEDRLEEDTDRSTAISE